MNKDYDWINYDSYKEKLLKEFFLINECPICKSASGKEIFNDMHIFFCTSCHQRLFVISEHDSKKISEILMNPFYSELKKININLLEIINKK